MARKPKFTAEEIADARTVLRGILDQVDTIYTVLYRVSRDGMNRDIAPLVAVKSTQPGKPPEIMDLSWLVAKIGLYPLARSGNGVTLGGCGMDMGADLVYNISMDVYGIGEDRRGGYKKSHRWL